MKWCLASLWVGGNFRFSQVQKGPVVSGCQFGQTSQNFKLQNCNWSKSGSDDHLFLKVLAISITYCYLDIVCANNMQLLAFLQISFMIRTWFQRPQTLIVLKLEMYPISTMLTKLNWGRQRSQKDDRRKTLKSSKRLDTPKKLTELIKDGESRH